MTSGTKRSRSCCDDGSVIGADAATTANNKTSSSTFLFGELPSSAASPRPLTTHHHHPANGIVQHSPHDVIMRAVSTYFAKHPQHAWTMACIVVPRRHGLPNEQSISLRVLDWYVTNYAREHDPRTHQSYRTQLTRYSKYMFDPFSRRMRVRVGVPAHLQQQQKSTDDGTAAPKQQVVVMTTTPAQLNFFRWAFQSGVMDFVSRNCAIIREDLIAHQRARALAIASSPSAAPTKMRSSTPSTKKNSSDSKVL